MAVNLAPADWFLHGRLGAKLYQLYREVAVLPPEKLLCVVAKVDDCDGKALPCLKKGPHGIYTKGENCREGFLQAISCITKEVS